MGVHMSYAKDFYPDLDVLKSSLSAGRHFQIRVLDRASDITVVAPHGGFIEPGSSYLAAMIAGEDFNLFDFQGLRRRQPIELHVTSTRFRDPLLDVLLQRSRLALSIHSMGPDGPGEVWVGGLNAQVKARVCTELNRHGFVARSETPRYRGEHPRNFVNLAAQKGVQIELSGDVMAQLFERPQRAFTPGVNRPRTTERFDRFVEAVRTALQADLPAA